ncbi:MAG: hypothetical protein WC756_01310 [Taibaiella sp.]|jgi:hypothetical protein
MLPREEKYIYEWETKRSKGKWSYLFLTAFVWGSIFPIVIKAFKHAFKGELSFSTLFGDIFTWTFFSYWIKFVIGFFIFAFFMWQLAKRKYLALKRKQVGQREFPLPADYGDIRRK